MERIGRDERRRRSANANDDDDIKDQWNLLYFDRKMRMSSTMFKDCVCLTLVDNRPIPCCNSLFISSFRFHGTCVLLYQFSWLIRRESKRERGRRIDTRRHSTKQYIDVEHPWWRWMFTFFLIKTTTSRTAHETGESDRARVREWNFHCELVVSTWQETCLCTVITFNPCFRLYNIIRTSPSLNLLHGAVWEREKCRSKFMAFKFTFLDQLSTNY